MLMLELPWSTFTLPKIPGEVGTIIIFLVLLTRTPKLNSQGTSSPRSHSLGTAETRQSSLFLTLGGGAPAHSALNTTSSIIALISGPSPWSPGRRLRGSGVTAQEVAACVNKTSLVPVHIAHSPAPTQARPSREQVWALGPPEGGGGGLCLFSSSNRQGLTVLPQVGHELVRGGVEERNHVVVQWVHVLGQPGAGVVVHLPSTAPPVSCSCFGFELGAGPASPCFPPRSSEVREEVTSATGLGTRKHR